MVTPSGDPALDDYDYFQSSNRMPIECAFGIIYQRWGVLWRPLRYRFDRRAPLVGACIRLHNFCIDQHYVAFCSHTDHKPRAGPDRKLTTVRAPLRNPA